MTVLAMVVPSRYDHCSRYWSIRRWGSKADAVPSISKSSVATVPVVRRLCAAEGDGEKKAKKATDDEKRQKQLFHRCKRLPRSQHVFTTSRYER